MAGWWGNVDGQGGVDKSERHCCRPSAPRSKRPVVQLVTQRRDEYGPVVTRVQC